jgi:hypothetical protein
MSIAARRTSLVNVRRARSVPRPLDAGDDLFAAALAIARLPCSWIARCNPTSGPTMASRAIRQTAHGIGPLRWRARNRLRPEANAEGMGRESGGSRGAVARRDHVTAFRHAEHAVRDLMNGEAGEKALPRHPRDPVARRDHRHVRAPVHGALQRPLHAGRVPPHRRTGIQVRPFHSRASGGLPPIPAGPRGFVTLPSRLHTRASRGRPPTPRPMHPMCSRCPLHDDRLAQSGAASAGSCPVAILLSP